MTLRSLLLLLLCSTLAVGCPITRDDDDAADDDDSAPDDDDAVDDDDTVDDDDAVDDDDVADDDDAVDDDDGADDDDAAPVDGDSDGSPADEDCDDADPDNFPGNVEVCDGQDNDCDADFVGECVGAVVITEIYSNPEGDETNKEWFELANVSGLPLDLNGWTLADQGTDAHVIVGALQLTAGAYVVLGQSTDPSLNDAAPVDYAYTGLVLDNGHDELLLIHPDGTTVDGVVYDDGATFPDQEATSMNLDPGSTDAISNNAGAAWCVSFAGPWASGVGQGSPGAANPGCAIAPAGLVAGDLLVTELLINPSGVDGEREWFEIHNTLGVGVDLQGWTVADDTDDFHVITQHVVVGAGGYAVIGRTDDPSLNGDTPVDYACYTGLVLANNQDEIILASPEGVLIDEVAYDGGFHPIPNGASSNLPPGNFDHLVNDELSSWCPATSGPFGTEADLGTPGESNDPCPSR